MLQVCQPPEANGLRTLTDEPSHDTARANQARDLLMRPVQLGSDEIHHRAQYDHLRVAQGPSLRDGRGTPGLTAPETVGSMCTHLRGREQT